MKTIDQIIEEHVARTEGGLDSRKKGILKDMIARLDEENNADYLPSDEGMEMELPEVTAE